MKKLLFLMLCIVPLSVYAQFDEQFYRPVKEWQTNDLPPYEEVWIANGADSVHSVLCKPVGGEIKAAVFFCHGNYGNISYTDTIIRPLVEDGFAVFAWDYPGFGYSSGTPTHVSIAAVGQKALDTMLERDDLKGRKVIVFGFSIGCQVAAKLARDNMEKVSALVLDAGMKSFTDMALLSSPPEHHPMIRQYVTSPYSALEDVGHLEGMPKLITHSQQDEIAPFSHSQAIFEAAADPKLFLEYPGGHVSALTTKKEEALALFHKLIE